MCEMSDICHFGAVGHVTTVSSSECLVIEAGAPRCGRGEGLRSSELCAVTTISRGQCLLLVALVTGTVHYLFRRTTLMPTVR